MPQHYLSGEKTTQQHQFGDAKIMEKQLVDAGLVSYPNSGHFSYLENLSQVGIVLKEFLKQEGK